MRILKYPLLSFFLFLLIVSCKKEEEIISNTPNLKFVSVNKNTIVEYQDSLVFNIEYTDGDGDLGENDPNVQNLFVTDSRIGITYPFRIPQLAPAGSSVPIKGTLAVVLNGVGRTDTTVSQQTVIYDIYAADRSGNTSNTVTTSVITVTE